MHTAFFIKTSSEYAVVQAITKWISNIKFNQVYKKISTYIIPNAYNVKN
jgi:hypothetical protein